MTKWIGITLLLRYFRQFPFLLLSGALLFSGCDAFESINSEAQAWLEESKAQREKLAQQRQAIDDQLSRSDLSNQERERLEQEKQSMEEAMRRQQAMEEEGRRKQSIVSACEGIRKSCYNGCHIVPGCKLLSDCEEEIKKCKSVCWQDYGKCTIPAL